MCVCLCGDCGRVHAVKDSCLASCPPRVYVYLHTPQMPQFTYSHPYKHSNASGGGPRNSQRLPNSRSVLNPQAYLPVFPETFNSAKTAMASAVVLNHYRALLEEGNEMGILTERCVMCGV